MKLMSSTLLEVTRRLTSQAPRLVVLAMVLACSALPLEFAAAQSLAQTPAPVADGSAKLIQRYNPNQMLRVTLSLRPPHRAAEDQFLEELYTKGSPQFHKFLSPTEWNRRFSPSIADEQAVLEWAKSQGLTVTHRYPNRMLVNLEAPAGVLEKAFQVTLNRYQAGTTTFFSSDREPQLPGGLQNIVTSVQGLNNLPRMHSATRPNGFTPGLDYVPGPVVRAGASHHANGDHKKFQKAMAASKAKAGAIQPATNGWYDPTDLYNSTAYDFQALYNQGHCCNPLQNPGGSPPETSIAIIGFGDLDYADLDGFGNAFPYLAYNVDKFFINGTPVCPPWDCVEVTLDAEWAIATSNSFGSYLDTSHVYLYESADQTDGSYTTIYNQMLTDNLARIMSESFVCTEEVTQPANSCDPAAMDARHAIFDAMVGQGWTLLSASGDWGAYNDCQHLSVAYPASDPDFVGVGGTYLLTSPSGFDSEMGWQGGTSAGSCASSYGGSGGGCSIHFAAPSYQSGAACFGNRSVPDIALNAIHSETIFFQGGLNGAFGTSIATPEMAGFYAQENAYLLYISQQNGNLFPIVGRGTDLLYLEGYTNGAPHNPFYDITTGCNSNDVANIFYYCAGPGYDMVTGWGTANMLQLAWGINWYSAAANGLPSVNFTGPAVNTWFNSEQVVSWTVTDNGGGYPGTGIAGFTQGWDSIPSDVYSEPTPGSGNSFYSGPQFPNATSGWLDFVNYAVSQGCHTAHVQAWNNMGQASGDVAYGPVCYDTIAPVTAASLSGTLSGGIYRSAVTVTLSRSDSGGGVAATYFQIDGGATLTYAGPFLVSATGAHTIVFHSTDVAGNVEVNKSTSFTIKALTSTSLTASANPTVYGKSVTFTATVTPAFGAAATGTVTFKNGATTLGAVALIAGKAAYSTSTLPAGAHSLTAVYGGSGEDVASTSAALAHTVNKAATSTLITSSVNPSSFGQSVTFKATVKSSTTGTPAGTVTFKDGATNLSTVTLVAGIASFNTGALSVSSHSITVVYSGNGNFLTSTSAKLTQTVKKANTTTKLTSSLNPSKKGQAVMFTASITPAFSGAPGGTVTFKDGATTLGTGTVNTTTKQATFKTSALSVATHSITAVYGGSVNFNGSTSAVVKQVVNP